MLWIRKKSYELNELPRCERCVQFHMIYTNTPLECVNLCLFASNKLNYWLYRLVLWHQSVNLHEACDLFFVSASTLKLGACVSECKRNLKGLQSHRMWDFTVFGARSYPSFYRTVKWNSVGDHAKCQEERASHLQQQQQKIQVYKIKIWQVEIIFSLNLLSSSFR